MRTEDLVSLLANNEAAVGRHIVARRFTIALVSGVLVAIALVLSLLGPRNDLVEVAQAPLFWLKVGYVSALVMTSLFAVLRLSRPGRPLAWTPFGIATPIVLVWIVAALALADAEPAERLALLLGATWNKCPLLIAMLSLPTFIATLWAMKGLGPTRLRLAGTMAGLLSGAVGALVYCLHCPEMAAPFFGSWYLLGMLIPAGVGFWIGPRVLRW